MKIPFIVKFVLFLILPVFIVFYFFVSFTAPSNFATINQEVNYWQKKGNYLNSSFAALNDLETDKLNLTKHYLFFNQYAQLKHNDRQLISAELKNVLGDPEFFYSYLMRDSKTYSIGLYGYLRFKTMLASKVDLIKLMDTIYKIPEDFPYINELKGDWAVKTYQKFEKDNYLRELKINPDNSKVKQKLFEIAFFCGDDKTIDQLIEEPEIFQNTELYRKIRFYHFETSYSDWLTTIFRQFFVFNDFNVIVNALFIFLVWAGFIFYINVFKEIKWKIILSSILLMLLSVPAIIVLYDWYYFTRPDDFEYNIFQGVLITGLFEEFVKFLFPIVIILLFVRKSSSPFFILSLFSFSALVFATIENMVYFGNYFDISIVTTRGVFSVTTHLCTGTLAGYGYVLFKFANRRWWNILLFYLAAVFIHGLYNLVAYSHLHFLLIPIIIICVFILVSIFNNSLNNSPGFNAELEKKLNNAGIFIISGLTMVILVEFASNAFSYGFPIGQIVFKDSLLSNAWIILVFASPLSGFRLVKNKWMFIDLGGVKSIDHADFSVRKINIRSVSKTNLIRNKSELQLQLIKNIRSSTGQKWFLASDDENLYYLVTFCEEGDEFIDSKITLHVVSADRNVSNGFVAKNYKYLGLVISTPVY